VNDAAGMGLAEVLAVLGAVRSVGCRFWIEGGWGVDALVGQQTRPHRDVDIDIDGAFEGQVLAALGELGYVVETDWRPNRVELVAPGRGWVDLHPLVIDDDGNARQAAQGGGWHEFPRSYFTSGHLGEVPVPCVSREAQRVSIPATSCAQWTGATSPCWTDSTKHQRTDLLPSAPVHVPACLGRSVGARLFGAVRAGGC
jgi:lincosamide nucleotidyltransferase A/C/D/E